MIKEMFKTGATIGIRIWIMVIAFFVLTIPAAAESSMANPSSHLTLNVLDETTMVAHWYIHCPGEYAAYLPFERERLEKNIADLEKGLEQLLLQDVRNIKITRKNETILITFDLKGDYANGFVAGKCRYLPELVRYAPIGLNVLKVVLPEDKVLSIVNPGPNMLKGNELTFYGYNWVHPLEISYHAEDDCFNEEVTAIIGEEWQIPQLELLSVEDAGGFDYEPDAGSKFTILSNWVGTGDDTPPGATKSALEIANEYKPWLYNRVDQCPDAVYYRVVKGYDIYAGFDDAYLIQYFTYWRCQDCLFAYHEYDYEPIFIWVRDIGSGEVPYRVAYDYWGGATNLHAHEIHRTYLWNSSSDGGYPMPPGVHTQHKAYYPFGRSEYDPDGVNDLYLWTMSTSLQDNWNGNHVKLGIATCYHTFDADISGSYCGDYSLSPLDDAQLVTWYRNEMDDDDPCDVCDCGWWESWSVMPFKYDISDPFYEVFWEDRYGKACEFPTLSATIDTAAASDGTLTVDVSVLYDNTGAGGSPENDLRGLWNDRFTASVGGHSIGNPGGRNEHNAGHYTLEFDVHGISPDTYTLRLDVMDNSDHNSAVDYETIVIPNSPPCKPDSPSPIDGATDVDINVDLSWSGGDPDGDPVTYDVYLEKDDSTPDIRVSNDQVREAFDPVVDYGSHYYWKITATDEKGATTDGDVWDFRTESMPIIPPTITYSAPPSPVADTEGAMRTFSITTDQIVDVIVEINGTTVQADMGVTSASYTNTGAAAGYWNVSAIATNPNGTAMQTWVWNVTPRQPINPADWAYSDTITITENSGSDLTDYQIRVGLTESNFNFSKQKPDGADIRFAEPDNTSLSYWIEDWNVASEGASIWVKATGITASSTTTIVMYYGNADAVSESDGSAVFEFFDDFEGTSPDMGKWDIYTEGTANYSVTGGELKNEVTGDGDCCHDPEARVNECTGSNFDWAGKRLRIDIAYQDIGGVAPGENSCINHTITIFDGSNNTALLYLGYNFEPPYYNRDGYTRDGIIEAIFKPDGDLFVYDDGEQIITAPSAYSVENGKIQLRDEWITCSEGLGGRTAVNKFGYIFMAECAFPEPTVRITAQKGDLNHDGALTSADVVIALEIAVSGKYLSEADIDENGCVNALDARMIMQAAAGAIEL